MAPLQPSFHSAWKASFSVISPWTLNSGFRWMIHPTQPGSPSIRYAAQNWRSSEVKAAYWKRHPHISASIPRDSSLTMKPIKCWKILLKNFRVMCVKCLIIAAKKGRRSPQKKNKSCHFVLLFLGKTKNVITKTRNLKSTKSYHIAYFVFSFFRAFVVFLIPPH